jgi:multiple sugar transport system ATP-binding protein
LIVAKLTLNKIARAGREKKGDVSILDLEIPDRQLVVLTGPPGSGKSSVVRMIAGLEKISVGQISIGEKRIDGLAPRERDVAMVFANDSLYPHMTMRENIAFGLKLPRFGKAEIKKRVEDAGNALGIEQFFEKRPDECYFVVRQRVAIARGVAKLPQVFLYDHALANLEPNSCAELRSEIVKLHERLQITTIFATSDDREAMSMAETIVLIDEAGLQVVGTPRVLYEQPENMVVAKFFGDPPMNFVRGELKLDRGALQFCEAEGGTIQVELSKIKRFEVARSFVGKSIFLGVRPEDIEVASSVGAKEASATANFRAIAERVEAFGPETNIYFHTGAHAGACQSNGLLDRSAVGRRMEFVINLEKSYFFDQSTGKRIV